MTSLGKWRRGRSGASGPTRIRPGRYLPLTALATGLWRLACYMGLFGILAGCSAERYRLEADREVHQIIQEKQEATLPSARPFTIDSPPETLRARLLEGNGADGPPAAATVAAEPDDLDGSPAVPAPVTGTRIFSLRDALLAAAENSREFQNEKESRYLTALALTLERHQFSNRFTALLSSGAERTDRENRSADAGADLSVTRRLAAGGRVALNLGVIAAKVLSGSLDSQTLSSIEFELVQPLLRGAGRTVALEGLVQAEREAVYAVQQFVRFQKAFAVRVISDYYTVLERQQIVRNERQNYENLIVSRRRVEALYGAGRLPEIEVGQTQQNEYRASDRWISARQQYQRMLDRFRVTLGLPTDSPIGLDQAELARLREAGLKGENIDLKDAVEQALVNRLDLLIVRSRTEDAARKLDLARNGLKADLDLRVGTQVSNRPNDVADLRVRDGRHSAGLALGLPLDRKAERNAFREAEISLERARRAREQTEDQVKLEVRDVVRQLAQARESHTIQRSAIELAQRRVTAANLLLDAGRAQTRDLLEAQEALVEAQNALVRSLVDHTIARLEFLRDTETLEVDEQIVPKGM